MIGITYIVGAVVFAVMAGLWSGRQAEMAAWEVGMMAFWVGLSWPILGVLALSWFVLSVVGLCFRRGAFSVEVPHVLYPWNR